MCKKDERCTRDEYTIDSYTHPEYSCKSNSFIPSATENNMFSSNNTLNFICFVEFIVAFCTQTQQ